MGRFVVKLVMVCLAVAGIDLALFFEGHRWLAVGLTAWTLAVWVAAFDEGRRHQDPQRIDYTGRHFDSDHH